MRAKLWLISWIIIVVSALSVFAYWCYKIDPYFHYHKPELNSYFYTLNNQRSQNDGIIKHFEYNALVSGTSMAENFRTSEVDEIFECNSIKVAYSGGSYKEINDNIKNALKVNPNLRIIIRSLDMGKFFSTVDEMRTDLGKYPTYLYDNNVFNDVEYLLNRDILFNRVYQMTLDNDKEGFEPGITTFDNYSRWQDSYVFGINTVAPDGVAVNKTVEDEHLSNGEKALIKENIVTNVTNVADEYPDVDFYYFYTPYSAVWWCEQYNEGRLFKQLEAERYITELILPHKNIHLFSFNNRTDLTTDLNNYKDENHYGTWINSLMLRWMHDGKYLLTEENYEDYLRKEYDFYTTFDYTSLNGQTDYEADYYAAALLNEELSGVKPVDILNNEDVDVVINGAEYIVEDGKNTGIDCKGKQKSDCVAKNTSEQIKNKEYIGIMFNIDMDSGYNYLCFNVQSDMDYEKRIAYVYDESSKIVGYVENNYSDLESEVCKNVMDLSTVRGNVTVILDGGDVDCTDGTYSECKFSQIFMY
ncbi:hypothetical protein D6856_10070 [Butyrivibrio sp. XB500-5]|uniref:hypothetical protein n=1 Tax=Butyrivibrio sp. XB500-5 TaxID=2364880 RepID=UPI000EA9E616|nr:hypothetical protein [Butyrivibrio sp. XB500-5]RKM59553.1 hypothetical protein D6856_10070 [Butyrivibrio sp. XB500-5]